jgi:hypothetical protein
MLRPVCAALVALAIPTLSFASTVSFTKHAAACSSGLCAPTTLFHADLNGDGLEDLIALSPVGHKEVLVWGRRRSYAYPQLFDCGQRFGKTGFLRQCSDVLAGFTWGLL